jgi:GGDEF domain-containing protein
MRHEELSAREPRFGSNSRAEKRRVEVLGQVLRRVAGEKRGACRSAPHAAHLEHPLHSLLHELGLAPRRVLHSGAKPAAGKTPAGALVLVIDDDDAVAEATPTSCWTSAYACSASAVARSTPPPEPRTGRAPAQARPVSAIGFPNWHAMRVSVYRRRRARRFGGGAAMRRSVGRDASVWLRSENHWLRQKIRALEEALRASARTVESLRALVYLDGLTGLPNRRSVDDSMARMLSAGSARPFAVLFVDLDNFKEINDSVGHRVADSLLQHLAATLDGLVRANDVLGRCVPATGAGKGSVLSRLGGDEFAILLPEVEDRAAAESVASRIIERFQQPFRAGDNSVFVTASIGIAIYPADGETADILIDKADSAMYTAKKNGKARYEFYRGIIRSQGG